MANPIPDKNNLSREGGTAKIFAPDRLRYHMRNNLNRNAVSGR
jgi:hypothetical protein